MVCGLHWHWLHDSTIDAGIVQGAATLVPGLLVAFIAWRGLRGWREQLLGGRKVQHSEACLLALDDLNETLAFLRSHVVLIDGEHLELSGKGADAAIQDREEVLRRKAADALGAFRQAYRKASFFILMPKPDVFVEFDESLGALFGAYRQAAFWARQGSDPEAKRERAAARAVFLGRSFSADKAGNPPELDPITRRLRDATDRLENRLLPIMGGGRIPAALR